MSVSTLPQPPQELASAIDAAASAFNVPPDLLTGIWRVEAGSDYPNPYANGLGYGGEFGTKVTQPFGSAKDVRKISEPPVGDQANEAAAILHNLLVREHGNIGQALYDYSGHGYTSVPGETSFGILKGVGSAVAEPGYGGQSTGSGTDTGQASNASVVSKILKPGEDVLFRLMFVLGGIALFGLGLVLLVRAFTGQAVVSGVAGQVADTASNFTPTGRAVRSAKRQSRIATASAPAARERRAEEQHQERVKTQAARTTEIRARSRRKTTAVRKEREALFNRGYIERATEEATPNLKRRPKAA